MMIQDSSVLNLTLDISNLYSLTEVLSLRSNNFNGSVPEIGRSKLITYLSLSANRLEGKLDKICNFQYLGKSLLSYYFE